MKLKISLFFAFVLGISVSVFAQDKNVKLPANWFNLDLTANGYFGISAEKAYLELLKAVI
ncbi:MAG: hypothetical protein EOO42_21330 [Flavobacteriales bacterium]|nr:MAG: hypothetical protein EOO42_21330 [Flavobacteriales bacterium]